MLQLPDPDRLMRGEVLSRDELSGLVPAWEGLCARAVENNVYYAPRYALALIKNIDRDGNLRFATVWQADTLVALLPFKGSSISAAARAWQTDYTFSCTPLLDRACPLEAATALVDLLRTINAGEWIVPTANIGGPACRAMVEALKNDNRPSRIVNSFQRAVVEHASSFDEHMRLHLSSKRRRDLARSRRRLEELGTVAHDSHRSGEGLDRAVRAFLKIESSGWKGRRGTALACHASTRQFAIDAFTGDREASICRADVLTLDSTPVAVGLTVFSGDTGFTVKGAYDETYRSYSVGLLLEVEVLRGFLNDRWASRLDGATNGAHVVDGLWSSTVEVGDLMFSLASRYAEQRLYLFALADHAKKTVKRSAKALVARVAG
ncbi:MAG: GNAT family N-acetyltransferase [Xanthobacteraceae bacterium]|nr:GNAT family N-acetyltransferase [Xanthobacteraceae bacterium]